MLTSEDISPITDERIPYRQAIGSFIFVVISVRPDIAFAVNVVSRFQNNFGKRHWNAVKRIFKYLKILKIMELNIHVWRINKIW